MNLQEKAIKKFSKEMIESECEYVSKHYVVDGHVIYLNFIATKTKKRLRFNEINELFDLFYLHLNKLKAKENNDFNKYKNKLLKIDDELISLSVNRELRQLDYQKDEDWI